MNDFATLIGSFFRRDLLYVMAGSVIVLTFILAINNHNIPNFSNNTWIVLSFISYISGYVSQEIFAVFNLVIIRDVSLPGRIFNFFNS